MSLLIKAKNGFKTSLVHILGPIALKLGYVKPKNKEILLHDFFSLLKESGFKPKHIVDIGAHLGTWTRIVLKYYPNAYYSLFEPQEWMKKSIDDILKTNKKIKFHAMGAGNTNGILKFTIVNRHDSCSFKYSEEEAISKGFEQKEVPIVTLNDFVTKKELPIPDIIKIDAEGFDIEVLEGCSDFFGKTEVFMVEAAISNPNVKNTLKSVIDIMDNKGYRILDFTELNRPWKAKSLWLVEAVFVKKTGFLDKITSSRK